MLGVRSKAAAVLLWLVLGVGTCYGLQTSGYVASVRSWTPYVVTAIMGLGKANGGPLNGQCENCNGTGVVGDGTIELKCELCDGTGRA